MQPGLYNLPNIRRGDTYKSITIVNGLRYSDGTPIPVTSARLQIKDVFDKLVTTLSVSISGASSNVLTTSALDSVQTSSLAVGKHSYELEVTTTAGETWTLLTGSSAVDADLTI